MLSDLDIKKYIASGDILITPWDEIDLDAARITLHLSERFLIPEGDVVIDPEKGTLPVYREVVATKEQPLLLAPNMFVLGSTTERIGLSEKIGMLIDGRSTIARLGVSVTQTAMIVDSGQAPKTMTLEIKNSGPQAVLLYPNMRIARACFFLLDQPASQRYDDKGRYQSSDDQRPILGNDVPV